MSRTAWFCIALALAAAVLLGFAVQQLLNGSISQTAASTNISGLYAKPLRSAIKDLGVEKERRTGYSRDRFEHWVDADKNGCNTRYEVLIAEARRKPTVGAGCHLRGGTWRSSYDGRTTSDPSTFDVDHLVPLAESWDSGARRWNSDTRRRFANDLSDDRALVAVSAESNRAKSDGDPAEWMPAKGRCGYVTDWVAIKLRWSLTVDPAERAALMGFAKSCPTKTVKVKKAAVKIGKARDDETAPQPTAAPTAGVRIYRIQYDAPGSDSAVNADDEWVEIANTSGIKADLTGWYVTDAAGARYTFGRFTLGAGSTVKVHSGAGSSNSGHVYAGWGHTWNNTGDTAHLYSVDGTAIGSCSYQPNSTGVAACP